MLKNSYDTTISLSDDVSVLPSICKIEQYKFNGDDDKIKVIEAALKIIPKHFSCLKNQPDS